MYATLSESNIMAYVNSSFTISSWLIMSNFYAVLIVFCQFFTWFALGDVDVMFLTHDRKKSQYCKRGN